MTVEELRIKQAQANEKFIARRAHYEECYRVNKAWCDKLTDETLKSHLPEMPAELKDITPSWYSIGEFNPEQEAVEIAEYNRIAREVNKVAGMLMDRVIAGLNEYDARGAE